MLNEPVLETPPPPLLAANKSLRFNFWADVSCIIELPFKDVCPFEMLLLPLLFAFDDDDELLILNLKSWGSLLSFWAMVFTVSWLNLAKTFMVSKKVLAPPVTPPPATTVPTLFIPAIIVLLALFSIFILFWFRCGSGLFVIDLVLLLSLLLELLLSDGVDDEEEAVDELDVVCLFLLFHIECWSLLLDDCKLATELFRVMGVIRPFLLRSVFCWDEVWLLNKLLSKSWGKKIKTFKNQSLDFPS